jgi:hypothetical protein
MNRDDDFIAQLEDYLDTHEGDTPLPDRVRDAVHACLPGTRQARPARGPGRMLDMTSGRSTPVRLGAIAAVLVAAVALGAVFATTRDRLPAVGSADATLSPSPSVASTPSPAASLPTALVNARMAPCGPDGGTPTCLEAGTYRLSSNFWPALITIEVPEGWWEWRPGEDYDGVLVESGGDAPDGSGWGLTFAMVDTVSKDPCDLSAGSLAAEGTGTVDGLVTAIGAWPGFVTTSSTPITIDGFTGRLIELASDGTTADCAASRMWLSPRGVSVDAYPVDAGDPSSTAQLRVLDVNGTLVVIRATNFPHTSPHELGQGVPQDPDRHLADQVELQQIIDSIQISTEAP